jgi:serine/threonine protein kinase
MLEILQGKQYSGAAADAWSLGVIMYCLLTGCFPWEGDTEQEWTKNASMGKFWIPTVISKECEQLLCGLLTVDPTHRLSISAIQKFPWLFAEAMQTNQ